MNAERSVCCSFLSRFAVIMIAGLSAVAAQQSPPPGAAIPRGLDLMDARVLREWLRERGAGQATAASSSPAFHDFQFSDRYAESGITFVEHAVEDANKYYKPVHYDHGTGVAVADIDGDGRLDLYFVDQIGENQLWRNLG